MNINEKTVNVLNVMQISLIRYMLRLHKSCHMKTLKILNIKHLICKYKINFVRQLLKKLQLERLEEIFAKTNENLERVKFCLENINDVEIKKILILLTNSYERKIIDNIGNLGS
jgi:hypothetical protein